MQIENLHWDSELFGYTVKKLSYQYNNNDELEHVISKEDFKLLYIFSKKKIAETLLKKIDAELADEKILFAKKVLPADKFEVLNNFKEITGSTKQILELAYQSGKYSRYKTDRHFRGNEFENLYKIWLQKSITKEIADNVTAYIIDGKTAGFITLKQKKDALDIGLIAVDKTFRRQQIGSSLLNFANWFAAKKSLSKIIVNTQAMNINAMSFYIKNGFEIAEQTFIYHVWK